MSEPRWIDVPTPDVALRALSWGPDEALIALRLNGFPDTAHGWRVVAPYLRGHAPAGLSADGGYQVGALMDDAVRILEAAGPTGPDVLIGHDWGAIGGAERAGHFLHLDRPEVARLIVDFVGG